MMRIMIYVFLLSVVISGCNAQQQQPEKSTYDYGVLKNYDLVNDDGIANFKYALYPPNLIIRSSEYSKLSEVNNESIEALITSSLSETSMEWYRYNRDHQRSEDSTRTYEKYYQQRKTHKSTYELLSKYTYEYDGQLYARVVAYMNNTAFNQPMMHTFKMTKIEGRWYFTKNTNPKILSHLAIGSNYIPPTSIYKILNKQPTNDGERLLLEQSLNGDGVLDFEKLSQAVYTIKEQGEENPAIQSLIIEEWDFSEVLEKQFKTNEPAKAQEREIGTIEPTEAQDREIWKNEPHEIKYSRSREKEVWGKILGENDIELFYGTPVYEAAKAIKDRGDRDREALKTWAASASKDLLNYQEPKYNSPLNLFAGNDMASVKILTEAGADPNIMNEGGRSAFLQSCRSWTSQEDKHLMKYLLENGGDPNAESSNGRYRTPLVVASGFNFENVKLLVEAGADYNYFKHRESPLLSALKKQKIHIVNYYIFEKGVDYRTLYKLSEYQSSIKGRRLKHFSTVTILKELRRMCFPIGSEEHIAKWKLIDYLKKEGLDYSKEPIHISVEKRYGKDSDYLKKY